MEALSPLVAGIVAQERERCNAAFQRARAADRSVDPERFAAHLAGPFDAVVRAIAFDAGDGLNAVTMRLYELSLAAMPLGLGEDSPRGRGQHILWHEVLTLVPRLVIQDPDGIVGGLGQAVARLATEDPQVLEQWLLRMRSYAAKALAPKHLLDLASVLVWRCGLPQYRESALQIWARLPFMWRRSILDVSRDVTEEALDRLVADPWFVPQYPNGDHQRGRRVQHRVGGFVGLGGPFRNPPLVGTIDDRFIVYEGGSAWVLHADRFGAALVPVPDSACRSLHEGHLRTITLDDVRRVDGLSECSAAAELGPTIIGVLPHSMYVFVTAKG